jgi:hypothetical protein
MSANWHAALRLLPAQFIETGRVAGDAPACDEGDGACGTIDVYGDDGAEITGHGASMSGR